MTEAGDFDKARHRMLDLAEQYPIDFDVQVTASNVFRKLGLYEQAYASLLLMLAMRPDLANATFRRVAKTMEEAGAPNRAAAVLKLAIHP